MAEDKARSANIFDVARLAGVSHQTVSRVVNDLPNVRESTRKRVEQAIKQLRYVPSPAARALVTRRSRTIGLITIGGPEWGKSATALHFSAAARDARYAVSMASMIDADDASLRSAAEMLLGQNVEAIVLAASRSDAAQTLASMGVGVPLIIVSSAVDPRVTSVAIDQYRGARFAVSHLVDLGHRDILHIAGPTNSSDAAERERGWRDVLADSRLAARETLIGDWSPSSGFAAIRHLPRDVTAIFAANDQMAVGAIHAIKAEGRRVPFDVSVVGFDDIPEAEHLDPALTTVRVDFRALGRDAFAAALAAIEGDPADASHSVAHLPELIVRSSSGALARIT